MRDTSLWPLRRICAAVLVMCYVWLSTAGALLHDCLRAPSPIRVTYTAYSTPSTAHSQNTHAAANENQSSPDTCPICTWQAANVSVALPVFEIVAPIALQQRVITTFPRYLKHSTPSSSSRAPPLA